MKVQNSENRQLRFSEKCRLSPTPPNCSQANKLNQKNQFLAKKPLQKGSGTETRLSKKLEILQSVRQNISENEYDLHQINHDVRQRPKNQQRKILIHKNIEVEVDGFLKMKKKKSSKQRQNSLYNPKSINKDCATKVIRQKQVCYLGMTRQKSQKVFGHGLLKKSVDSKRIVSAVQIKHSKQILREIDLEKQKEQQRQAELQAVDGLQARRLQKIHMIERVRVQQKLQSLKKLQETCVEALTTARSFC